MSKTTPAQIVRNRRAAGGQAIVEGVAILVLIVAIFVGLILFLTDFGMTLTYQQKITHLAMQAALRFSAANDGWNYQNTGAGNVDVDAFVKQLAGSMSLPPERVSATVNRGTTPATVTVIATGLPLMPGVTFLPGTITVQQSFAADRGMFPRPTGILALTVSTGPGAGPTVVIPCYSGLATGGNISSRAVAPQAPIVPGPGMYDQFTFSVPTSTGASLTSTPGSRGMVP